MQSHLFVPTPLIIIETRTNGVTTEFTRWRPKGEFDPETFLPTMADYITLATLFNPDEVIFRFLRPQQE